MSKFNTPQKWKKFMKHAQNGRCTSSICEQSFGKVWMKRNKNFWSYRLHKLGTPKVLRTDRRTDGRTDRRTDGRTDGQTDGRSGPITRPAFAKATQVKKTNWRNSKRTHTHTHLSLSLSLYLSIRRCNVYFDVPAPVSLSLFKFANTVWIQIRPEWYSG